MYNYSIPIFWAAIVLLGFVGIGRITKLSPVKSWGFEAATGMATFIILGGILLCLGIATGKILISVILLGNFLLIPSALTWWRQGAKINKRMLPLLLAGIVILLTQIHNASYNINDDQQIYFAMSERIGQTGTLYEPFSLRRAGTYGGFSVIQAAYHQVASYNNAWIPDRGISKLILAGLLIGLLSGVKTNKVVWLVGLALLIFPDGGLNTYASVTILVLSIPLLQALLQSDLLLKTSTKDIITISLFAAAMVAVRPTAGMLAAFTLASCFIIRPLPKLKNGTIIAVFTSLLIAPYAWVLFKSNGTIAMPPFSGNVNPDFTTFTTVTGTLGNVLRAAAWFTNPSILLLLTTILLAKFSDNATFKYCLYAAGLITTALIAYKIGEVQEKEFYRYTVPMLLGIGIITTCRAAENAKAYTSLSVIGILFLITTNPIPEIHKRIETLPLNFTGNAPTLPDMRELYTNMQGITGDKSTILAITPSPYLFDYTRNKILNLDVPGACSPEINGKHLDFKNSEAELEDYLTRLGINYIIVVDPESPIAQMYSNSGLTKFDESLISYPPMERFFGEMWGPQYRGMWKLIDKLSKSNPTAKAGTFQIIKLTK